MPSRSSAGGVAGFRQSGHAMAAGARTYVVRAWGGGSSEVSNWAGFLYPDSASDAEIRWKLPPANSISMVSLFRVSPGTTMYIKRVEGGTGMEVWLDDPTQSLVRIGYPTTMAQVARSVRRNN